MRGVQSLPPQTKNPRYSPDKDDNKLCGEGQDSAEPKIKILTRCDRNCHFSVGKKDSKVKDIELHEGLKVSKKNLSMRSSNVLIIFALVIHVCHQGGLHKVCYCYMSQTVNGAVLSGCRKFRKFRKQTVNKTITCYRF